MSTPRRLPAFAYIGCQRYFLTICTRERAVRFTDDADVTLVYAQIWKQATVDDMEITAYCYMPDHWHALVTGTSERADLRHFVDVGKQRSGWHYARRRREQLWQKGYYERVLRDDEATAAVIEYIVNNPVRRELVEKPVDYPYWGSSKYTREQLLEFIGSGGTWRP